MAIYHLKVQVLSRSAGKTAIAAAAYRSASLLKDERQNLVFDYTRKQGVAHSIILTPENAPEWTKDREKLWNAVERAETRINSQIAREIDIAIPVELTKTQGIKLVEEFANREFVKLGMIADVNIHLDNPENPHAHILLTTREISSEGFTVKNRSWNDKEKLKEWRRSWAEIANEHLRAAGYETGIDHRSYKDQGIDLIPSTHLGPLLHSVLQNAETDNYQRLVEYQQIAQKNGAKVIANPEIALEALTAQQAVFSETDIYKFVSRNSIDLEQFEAVTFAIKNNAIQLAKTEQGKLIYTSREMVELESGLIKAAIELNKTNHHKVATKYQEQALHGTWLQKIISQPKLNLNDGQLKSLSHILEEGDLKIIIGFAGTGKSTLMSIAQKAWEGQGYRVLGTALSGIAAQNLQESGIQSRTIDSLLLALERSTLILNSQDILVIDEAGMVNSQRLAELLYVAQSVHAKVVMLGDPEQLQAIQAGAPFRAIAERVGYSELNEIVRQQDPIMQQASQEFATERTWQALDRYQKLGAMHEHKTRFDAIDAVIDSWSKDKDRNNSIMLAYTRKDVAALNEKARSILKTENALKHEHALRIKNREGEEIIKPFAVNEQIYFIRNDSMLGVKNGSLGKIRSIEGDLLTVLLDTDKTIVFSLDDYNSIDHGYAATIHKAQGITVDKTYFLADKYLDRHATYVAATRHRHYLEIHYDRETFKYSQELYRTLGREKTKDMVVDYADMRDLQSILEAKEASQTFIKCDKALEEMLTCYLDKQIELDKVRKLKTQAENIEKANDYSYKAQTLGKELAKDAQRIINHPQVKEFAQTRDQSSFYERGGAQKVKERLQSKQLMQQDFLAISREVYSRSLQTGRVQERSLQEEREISY